MHSTNRHITLAFSQERTDRRLVALSREVSNSERGRRGLWCCYYLWRFELTDPRVMTVRGILDQSVITQLS